jgi:hypothetical protein
VPYAIEAPFSIWIGGRLIRGRIDAVYQRSSESRDTEFQVVDWKTGRAETADPLQLAIYRLAWAEAYGLQPSEIDAIFYHVPTDEIVRPKALPDRQAIAAILMPRFIYYPDHVINWAIQRTLTVSSNAHCGVGSGLWHAEDAVTIDAEPILHQRWRQQAADDGFHGVRQPAAWLLGLNGSPIFAEELPEGEMHDSARWALSSRTMSAILLRLRPVAALARLELMSWRAVPLVDRDTRHGSD